MRDEVGLGEGANGLVEEVTTLVTNEFQGAPKRVIIFSYKNLPLL